MLVAGQTLYLNSGLKVCYQLLLFDQIYWKTKKNQKRAEASSSTATFSMKENRAHVP